MKFDQSLLDQRVSTTVELLFQRCSNAAEKRTIASVQTLIQFRIGWMALKLTTQAHMQKLGGKLVQESLQTTMGIQAEPAMQLESQQIPAGTTVSGRCAGLISSIGRVLILRPHGFCWPMDRCRGSAPERMSMP